MNECQTCKNARNSKPLSIKLLPTPPDEKLAFVQNVLDVLIESRYGPGRSTQMAYNLSDRPELEPCVFLDLEDGLKTPCYAVGPEGRYHYQVMEMCYRRFKQSQALEPLPLGETTSPQTLGRGSPQILWDVCISAPPDMLPQGEPPA